MRYVLLFLSVSISGCEGDGVPVRSNEHNSDMVSHFEEPCTTMIINKDEINLRVRPTLTVEESLGVACRSRFSRHGAWHICRGVNPAALPRIVELLKNPAEKEIWPSAIQAIAYIGGDSEALLLETMVRKKYTEPTTLIDEETFRNATLGLGLIARRAVPEARRIVDSYCEPDFWLDTAQPWISRHPLGSHAIARVTALQGKLLADWSVDAPLCARLVAENKDFEGYADAKDLTDVLCRMSVEETKQITPEERIQLRKFYDEYFGE